MPTKLILEETVSFHLRVPVSVEADVRLLAEHENRSLNREYVSLIQEGIKVRKKFLNIQKEVKKQ